MTKRIGMALLLVILLCLFSATALAENGPCNASGYPDTGRGIEFNADYTWSWQSEGAQYLKVTFAPHYTNGTTVLTDASGNDHVFYDGAFANDWPVLYLTGNHFTLHFTYDYDYCQEADEGIEITDISPISQAQYTGSIYDANGYPESEHTVRPNADVNWSYTYAGAADFLAVTFSGDTNMDSGSIYLTDAENHTTAYASDELAGQTVYLEGNSFTLRMTSADWESPWGFAITDIRSATAGEAIGRYYDANGYPESEHPVRPNAEVTWTYTYPGTADYLAVTFHSDTDVDGGCIYLTDAQNNTIEYNYDQLAGHTVYLAGNSFTLHMVTPYWENYWGFAITSIAPATETEYTGRYYDANGYPESEHPVRKGADVTWTYTYPGAADYLAITFHSETYVHDGSITLTDANGNAVSYSSDYLAEQTVYLAGNSFTLNMTTPDWDMYWGFAITEITPVSETVYTGAYYDANGYPESEHPCRRNADITWTYTYPGEADYLAVTFHENTYLDSGHIYLTDAQNNTKEYAYHDLTRQTVYLAGNSFTLRMTTPYWDQYWGFAITEIAPATLVDYTGEYYDANGYPESEHPCRDYADVTWTYTYPQPADYLAITFHESTYVSWGTIELTDAQNNTSAYSYDYLSGETLYIPGNSFTLHMDTQTSDDVWGLAITNIAAVTEVDYTGEHYDANGYPESEHDSRKNADITWTYTYPSAADYLAVTFHEDTYVHYGCITLTDVNGDEMGYSYGDLSDKTVFLPGNSFTLRMLTPDGGRCWGFAITEITAATEADYTGEHYDANGYPESEHPSRLNADITWTYTYPGAADYLAVTFHEDTHVDSGTLTVTDAAGNETTYNYNYLAGQTLYLPGNSFTLHMTTPSWGPYWGFAITRIAAVTEAAYTGELYDANGYPVSEHLCRRDMDVTWTYTYPGTADYLAVTFHDDTDVGNGHLYLTDAENNETEYSYSDLAGETVYLAGNSFTLRLTTPDRYTYWGFAISSITPATEADFTGAYYGANGYPVSEHPVRMNADITWTYTYPSAADFLAVTFHVDTYVDGGRMYLTDAQNNTTEYSYSDLAGETVYLAGNSFTLRMTTVSWDRYWGFAIDDITPITADQYTTGKIFDQNGYPESLHPYAAPCDLTWRYQYPDTSVGYLKIKFSDKCYFASCAALYLTDAEGNETEYTWDSLRGRAVKLVGNYFILRLKCEYDDPAYGFHIDSIVGLTQDEYNGIYYDENGYPESEHPYEDNLDISWSYTYPGTGVNGLLVTFTDETDLESGCDYLHITAGDSTTSYTGDMLRGTTISVPGSSFTMHMTTDVSIIRYGFKIASITPITGDVDPRFGVYDGIIKWYTGTETALTIPSVLNGQTIVGIADNAFESSAITRITLPSTLEYIGYRAFCDCDSLASVTLNGTDLTIASEAFAYCDALTSIHIPAGVASIGDSAFYHCDNLQSVYIEDGATYIGRWAFAECGNLSSVRLPATLEDTGGEVFVGCGNLKSLSLAGLSCELDNMLQGCGCLESIVIPDTITVIGDYAFSGCSSLTSVTLPQTLTSIGQFAFNGCGLTSIQIPGSVTEIGYMAFVNCELLTSVTLPGSLEQISSYCFYDCGLTSVTIPSGVKEIGGYAFGECGQLASVSLPQTLESVGNRVFYHCDSLETVTLPSTLEDIGTMFAECTGLKSITLPAAITVIPDSAFWGCSSLESVQAQGTITSIGSAAFYACYGLTSYTVPSTVTSIGPHAFYDCVSLAQLQLPSGLTGLSNSMAEGCAALKSIQLPSGLTGINYRAFARSGLESVEIPSGVTSLSNEAFCLCDDLASVTMPATLQSISGSAFSHCPSLTSVTVPEGVTYLGDYAFAYCDSLASVSLPDSLESIGYSVFYECPSLESVTIPPAITDINGVFSGCTGLKYITLSSGFTEVSDYAFADCENLENVTLPSTLQRIGYYAFSGCTSLETLQIPASVTVLDEGAFYGCTSLTNVVIPDNVETIGYHAFAYCSGIESITIPGSVTEFSSVFYNCANLKTLILSNSITAISDSAFVNCTSLENVTLSNSLESIGDYAFSGCTSLKAISLPATLTSLGAHAFDGCVLLSDVVIPDSVETIGYHAFANCSGIESITIPGSVTEFSSVFYNCSNLKTLILSNSITAVSSSAFAYCESLENVTLSNSLLSIGDHAFYGCSSLKAITLPATLTALGSYSFAYCGQLTDVVIPDSVETIGEYAFAYCYGIESITIPGSVTDFNSVFYRCTNLRAVTLSDSMTALGDGAFMNCTGLEVINLSANLQTIGSSALEGCTGLQAVTIPAGVTSIGSRAFMGCTGLQAVFVPAAVQSIGDEAFANCYQLASVTLAEGLKTIGSGAFISCAALTDISLPSTLEALGDYAFNGCSLLGEIVIPGGVGTVRQNAFGGCVSLTRATLLSGVTAVEAYAFSNCDALETLVIGSNLTSVAATALNSCDALTTLTFAEGVTAIGLDTFKGRSSLTTVTFPSTLQTIAADAFRDCDGLTAVSVPANLGDYAFYDCDGLTEVTLLNGVTSVGDLAFGYCDNLATLSIPGTLEHFENDAFIGCTNLASLIFGEGVQSIGASAFAGYAKLAQVTLPSTLTSIGANAFDGCSALQSIALPSGLTSLGAAAFRNCAQAAGSLNVPGGIGTVPENAFKGCAELTDVTIGSGITAIGASAFDGCAGMTNLTIAADLTSVADNAFDNCGALESLTFSEGVTAIGYDVFRDRASLTAVSFPSTLQTIGENAFNNCDGLVTVELNDGLTTLGDGAFSGCLRLKYVTYPGTIETYTNSAFLDCPNLFIVTLKSGVRSIADSAFAGYTKLARVNVPYTLKTIGAHAFDGCTTLRVLNLPGALTGMGESAFLGCVGLKSIAVPATLKNIPANAFKGSGLTSVTLNQGILSIGDGAFENCADLTEVTLPDSVTSLGASAFAGSGLTAVSIPASITAIPASAFSGCAGLTSVTLAETLNSIGSAAFAGCNALGAVTIPDQVSEISANAFPKANETLNVRCNSYARTWAEANGYAVRTEENSFGYLLIHKTPVDDPAVAPTCLETGLTEGSHCGDCDVILVAQEIVDALGHDWSAPVYTWAADNLSVTAVHVCARDESHTETETVSTEPSVTKPATCTEMGDTTYTSADFENAAFIAQTKTLTNIDALGHDWNAPEYTWAADNLSVTAIHVCARDESHTETETATVTPSVAKASTCTEMGDTTYTTADFANAAFAVQTKTVTDIAALGHDWNAPVYTWAADNLSVTAIHVCARDENHTETETASAEPSVTKAATCTEMGDTTYTSADFENAAFTAQVKTLTNIPALGHAWNEPTYVWAGDHSAVTAARVCAHDAAHVETETAGVTWTLIQSPTETANGIRAYVSNAFLNAAFAVQETAADDVPALGTLFGLRLPAALTAVDKEAFANGAFQYVIVPETCLSIGPKAFADCAMLVYIRIPAGVEVAADAFDGCGAGLIIDRLPN